MTKINHAAARHIDTVDPKGTKTACQVIMLGYRDGFTKGQMIVALFALFAAEGHKL